MLFSQAKSLDIIVPRNLKQSTVSIESPLTIMGACAFYVVFSLPKIYDHLSSFWTHSVVGC